MPLDLTYQIGAQPALHHAVDAALEEIGEIEDQLHAAVGDDLLGRPFIAGLQVLENPEAPDERRKERMWSDLLIPHGHLIM